MSSTGTTLGAREHARAQATQASVADEAMPLIPPSQFAGALPDGVSADDLTWAETIPGGGYSSIALARGSRVRLTDLTGDACAHILLYNREQPCERLNAADSVKVPWQAYIGVGHPLLSDLGRALATVVADSAGAHDAIAGTSSLASNTERYGAGDAHSATPAGRELFKLAAAKHGLAIRDLAPSISFFKSVRVADDGALEFGTGAGAGKYVEFCCELPLVLLVVNTPHPLDARSDYICSKLELLAWPGEPTGPGDPLWSSTPELERALQNSTAYADAAFGRSAPPATGGAR